MDKTENNSTKHSLFSPVTWAVDSPLLDATFMRKPAYSSSPTLPAISSLKEVAEEVWCDSGKCGTYKLSYIGGEWRQEFWQHARDIPRCMIVIVADVAKHLGLQSYPKVSLLE